MNCTICGRTLTDESGQMTGTTVGDGDGTGQRFAHYACYFLRDAIRELMPWAPPSIQERVRMHAMRRDLTIE